MKTYLNLVEHVLTHGALKKDRTGTGVLSVFGHQMRFDLAQGFPLLTTKKLHLKSIIHGMHGPMMRVIWVLFMGISGAVGVKKTAR